VTGRARLALRARFYRTATGARPVRDWLLSLSKEVRREIGADVERVQWQWPVGRPVVDGFGGGLYEVRTSLVHEIHKKTQKTPAAAVALARKRRKEGT
jgi:phage-related protein